eukprot:762713-Hanusia_phi.AAC.1
MCIRDRYGASTHFRAKMDGASHARVRWTDKVKEDAEAEGNVHGDGGDDGEQEEEMLAKGVSQHGPRWTTILTSMPGFHACRT